MAGKRKSEAGVSEETELSMADIEVEEDPLESERTYRTIFEGAGTAIVVDDEDTTILLVNKEYERLTGFSREDLCGKRSWTGFVLKADLDRFVSNHHRRRVSPDGVPDYYECQIRNRSGAIRDVLVNVRMIPGTRKTVTSIQDVTEWKQIERALNESENRFRSLFEKSLDIFYVLDIEGRFIDANNRALDHFGYKNDEISTLSITDLVHPEDIPKAIKSMAYVLKHGTDVAPLELRLQTKNGTPLWIETTAVRLDRSDLQSAILGIARDITKRKKAEERLRSLEGQLHLSFRMEAIGKAAEGFVRDFRGRFEDIRKHAGLLLSGIGEKDPMRPSAEAMAAAADQGAELVRQLAASVRKPGVRPQNMDVKLAMTDAESLLRQTVGGKVRLSFRSGPDPCPAAIHPDDLKVILTQLTRHARDSMPDGGELVIETSRVDLDEEAAGQILDLKPGPFVLLSVSHTGKTMDDEGLFLVYSLVRQNRGHILMSGDPGKGTTFRIYLPEADGQPQEPSVEITRKFYAPSDPSGAGG